MNYTKLLVAFVSFVFLVSAVSAMSLDFSTLSVPTSVSQSAGSFNVVLNVSNTGADGDVNVFHTVNSGASVSGISYSPSSTVNVNGSQSRTVTATVSFSSSQTGSFNITFSADDITGSGTTKTTTISVPITTSSSAQFCDAGAKGTNLSISSVDISSSGDDDEEWRPLDKIEVEVDVDNDGDSDLEDVYVELGIFDSSNNDVSDEFEFTNTDEEKVKIGDLDEGDDDTAVFEFSVPGDLDDGNYKVVAKVYSRDAGESNLCADSFSENIVESVSIEAEDDEGRFIAFDEIEFSPSEATCGDSVTMNFDVLNIGEDDQDQVRVTVSSNDLQINQVIEFTKDIDRGDKESASVTFTIPSGLADKLYTIEIDAEYDYDDGLYEERLDDAHKMSYKVFGCSVSSGNNKVVIGATLASDAIPGQPLVVRSTITNTDSKAGTFIVDASSLGSWATLDSISERIFTLNSGESKTVQITIIPNSGVSGEQSFNIDVRSGDKVETRSVVVSLGSSSSLLSSLGENKLAWIIGIINVVLIVLIILVAIKISRR